MTERVTRWPIQRTPPSFRSGIERGRGTAGTTVLPPLSFIENDTAQNNAKIY